MENHWYVRCKCFCTICSASSPSWMYAWLLIFALTFLLPADLCQKIGDVVSPKLADYDVEWKHLYVASFTIDIMNRYTRKLLSIGIPLSHPLCFPDLPLYATLQQSCSCAERSMSMEFFPTRLTPTLTKYLHQFMGSSTRTGSLICWSIVLCWGCPIGIKNSVYFLIIFVIIQHK